MTQSGAPHCPQSPCLIITRSSRPVAPSPDSEVTFKSVKNNSCWWVEKAAKPIIWKENILLKSPTYRVNPEKIMAPHSRTLAWKIPWAEEPGRLQSMGSLRVGHDWATSFSLFTFMHWRRKWQPTPVFLPGESQGRGSLVGCGLWGRTESDTTEVT